MLSSNAVVVDLSNLNVLFYHDSKFTMALNYGSALDRLGSVLAAFGPGYDVYLCLRPRRAGEGDYVVQELSLSAAPFVVDAEELHSVLKYFRSCSGVNEVLLCNWLNNYVEEARTTTFDSAFYYGSRVAKVSVKDKMITDFKIYDNVRDFGNVHGEEFDGYGDVGLLDVDGLKAQYPEFTGASKAQLMALAPLVHCMLTRCYMGTDELYEKLEDFLTNGESEPEEPLVPEEPKEEPLRDMEYVPDPPRIKAKTPAMAAVFFAASLLLSVAIGVSAHYTLNGQVSDNSEDYYNSLDTRVINLQQVAEVYRNTSTATFDTVGAYDYAGKSGLNVEVIGFERYPLQYVVRCNCASEDIINAYIEYIGQSYIVLSTNDLGIVEQDGGVLRQFSVMFN